MEHVEPEKQIRIFDSSGRDFFVSDIEAVRSYASGKTMETSRIGESILFESIITALKCGYVIGKGEQ